MPGVATPAMTSMAIDPSSSRTALGQPTAMANCMDIKRYAIFFQELSQSVVSVLHYVTSPQITIAEDGRTATGTFYLHCLSRFRRKDDKSLIDFVVIMGVYEDKFVKTNAGWRFESINVNVMHTNRLDT